MNIDYYAIFNRIPDALVICDSNNVVQFINIAAERLFHIHAEELVGEKKLPWLDTEAIRYVESGQIWRVEDIEVRIIPVNSDKPELGKIFLYRKEQWLEQVQTYRSFVSKKIRQPLYLIYALDSTCEYILTAKQRLENFNKVIMKANDLLELLDLWMIADRSINYSMKYVDTNLVMESVVNSLPPWSHCRKTVHSKENAPLIYVNLSLFVKTIAFLLHSILTVSSWEGNSSIDMYYFFDIKTIYIISIVRVGGEVGWAEHIDEIIIHYIFKKQNIKLRYESSKKIVIFYFMKPIDSYIG